MAVPFLLILANKFVVMLVMEWPKILCFSRGQAVTVSCM